MALARPPRRAPHAAGVGILRFHRRRNRGAEADPDRVKEKPSYGLRLLMADSARPGLEMPSPATVWLQRLERMVPNVPSNRRALANLCQARRWRARPC